MNKLILIGNGFDLAHDLKTSYSHFMLWYLNKGFSQHRASLSFEDNLMEIAKMDSLSKEFKTLNDFQNTRKYGIVNFKNVFFEELINHTSLNNWVDIESKYYNSLTSLYKRLEASNYSQKAFSLILRELKDLNNCFNNIKIELREYLMTIDVVLDKKNEDIIGHLREKPSNSHAATRKTGIIEHCETHILNFNYTSTIENYLNKEEKNFVTNNYIHGKLDDEGNPIIFGYGDEMHQYYDKIEQLDLDEFLMHIKSFGYFKTTNYQNLANFIDSGPYNVHIMGHSCGLSDRVLLNSIFENDNCYKVKIFYHQKNSTDNDYFEKTQRISRHFKASSKGKMRTRIIPYSESVPLIKFKP
ncbi:MAG: AbiH family protein [Bacteroidota bacterium]|nr:AbiH family protein [Bacteroidota bacterium]